MEPADQQFYTNQQIQFQVKVVYQSCSAAGSMPIFQTNRLTKIYFQILASSGAEVYSKYVETSQQLTTIQIPKYALQPDTSYSARVFSRDASNANINKTIFHDFYMNMKPYALQILSSNLIVSADQSFSINASIHDPEYQFDAQPPGLASKILWQCQDISMGAKCKNKLTGNELEFERKNSTDIPGGTFSAFSVIKFTVLAFKNQLTSSSLIYVHISNLLLFLPFTHCLPTASGHGASSFMPYALCVMLDALCLMLDALTPCGCGAANYSLPNSTATPATAADGQDIPSSPVVLSPELRQLSTNLNTLQIVKLNNFQLNSTVKVQVSYNLQQWIFAREHSQFVFRFQD